MHGLHMMVPCTPHTPRTSKGAVCQRSGPRPEPVYIIYTTHKYYVYSAHSRQVCHSSYHSHSPSLAFRLMAYALARSLAASSLSTMTARQPSITSRCAAHGLSVFHLKRCMSPTLLLSKVVCIQGSV